MSGQANDGKVGVISRELKRDVYENEKDLAFAKSSSLLSYCFPLCSQDNSIYPWRIKGVTSEQKADFTMVELTGVEPVSKNSPTFRNLQFIVL